MAVTVQDIARKVGVNSSTVSRVLNGYRNISEETRRKVLDAARELNYHPNSIARNLAKGSSASIGVVLDASNSEEFSNFFFSRSLFAIERAAQSYGYNVIISSSYKEGEKRSPIEDLVMQKQVDGLIVPPFALDAHLLDVLNNMNFPYVFLGQPARSGLQVSWVDLHNAQGSAQAVAHLYERGYQRICFLGGNPDAGFVKQRITGYTDAIEAHQKPYVVNTKGTPESAEKASYQALKNMEEKPDAFICCDNYTAFGLMSTLKRLQLNVPKQVGIVTFDNFPLAEFMDPPLTAIDIDTDLLGEQCATMLFQRIEKPMPSQQMLLSTTLIKRKSTERA